MRRSAAFPLLVAATTALVAACRDERPPGTTQGRRHSTSSDTSSAAVLQDAQTQRRMAPALDQPRWIRGGSERDTLFSFPRTLAVDRRHLYVLDADTHRLSALRLADGSLDWQVGGPDDSSVVPVALTAAPGGGATVADATHARLVTLDGRGRPTSSIPFATSGDARSLCTLPDGALLVAGTGPAGALLRVSPSQPSPRPVPLPWSDLAARHRLTVQLTLASDPDSPGCVVALVLGRGFAFYDGTTYDARRRYAESFDLPHVIATTTGDSAAYTRVERLDDSRIAARDVAMSASRLVVAFDGSSPLRARVLDFYDRPTGAYTRSVPFPGRITAVADDGHDLYVAFTRHGRAAVAAIHYPSPVGPTPPPAR